MRTYHKAKLMKLLSLANDEKFFQLLWATHAIQSEYWKSALPFFNPASLPKEAITTKFISEYSIHPWELETLANELMTTPKKQKIRDNKRTELNCTSFRTSVECANVLRKIENLEYLVQKKPQDILIEMGRIAARQFDWQRGYLHFAKFYRSIFVYGQGRCADFFHAEYGIPLEQFSRVGFMLFAAFTNQPAVRFGSIWEKMGVSSDVFYKVLSLISLDYKEAVRLATNQRRTLIHTADKQSILRQYPCIRFGGLTGRVRAPLPELIIERITSGVFYDLVRGDGNVRNDYGMKFEEYCSRYLEVMLPAFSWSREYSFRVSKKITISSPDIICEEKGEVVVAIECKATRMSHAAMFGRNPIEDRGYSDLSKAIFQLWRYFSQIRKGNAGRMLSDEAVGIVLTLDNWLVLSESLRAKVFEEANRICAEKDPDITGEDRRPIVFIAISELEKALSISDESTFKLAVTSSKNKEYFGWRFDSIVNSLTKDTEIKVREYPFKRDLGRLLPWWDEMRGDEEA